MILTASRLMRARACQRLHYYEYVAGYRPATARPALAFGALMHRGLEAWWATGLSAALAAVAAEPDPFVRILAEKLLEGYDARWGAEPYETLGVEVEFHARLVRSRTWSLAGKLDAIARHTPSGQIVVVEHKTTSSDISPGSEYWARLRMDGQVSIYIDGARALGHAVDTVVYDVVSTATLPRPRRATPPDQRRYTKDGRLYAAQRLEDETPAEYRERICEALAERGANAYARGSIIRRADDLASAREDISHVARQLGRAMRAGEYPRNPDACWRYGSLCPYFDVCTGVASLDDSTRFTKLTNSVHPELTEHAEGMDHAA